MNCTACSEDGTTIGCIFDQKHAGEVCPACGRVYNPMLPIGMHHFVDKKSAMAGMKRDELRKQAESVSTKALVERIFADRF